MAHLPPLERRLPSPHWQPTALLERLPQRKPSPAGYGRPPSQIGKPLERLSRWWGNQRQDATRSSFFPKVRYGGYPAKRRWRRSCGGLRWRRLRSLPRPRSRVRQTRWSQPSSDGPLSLKGLKRYWNRFGRLTFSSPKQPH